MEILIAATKACQHRPMLEEELQQAKLPYKVMYFEEHPELVNKYQSKHSPLLIVDEKVESIGMPGPEKINELKGRNPDISQVRAPKRDEHHMIPKSIDEGLVEVDITWGSVQPMQAAPEVQTIGEIEVYHHLEQGLPVIDTRKPGTTGGVTIPGSKSIPYDELTERKDELDKDHPNIFFCNGPQCPQSPTAINNLLKAGFPAGKMLYYRGGMHDWITLGMPLKKT